MAKVTKAIVDKQLREAVFEAIFTNEIQNFVKINDRQYGVLLTDLNGTQRYVRIGAIVAEERKDMTAEELMQAEIDAYQTKQDEKAEKAKKKAQQIAIDKARREAEKTASEEDDPNQFLPHEVTY